MIDTLSKAELAENYIEILQPLEGLVSYTYKVHPEIYDLDVQKAYECLLNDIKAKLTNHPLPHHKIEGLPKSIYTQLTKFLEKFEIGNTYSLKEIQACLKLVEKSLKLWTRQHGSRGYLNFITQFNP